MYHSIITICTTLFFLYNGGYSRAGAILKLYRSQQWLARGLEQGPILRSLSHHHSGLEDQLYEDNHCTVLVALFSLVDVKKNLKRLFDS